MSVACFEGEWLLWAGLSGVAMLVYGALLLPRAALASAPCAPTHTFLHALRAHTSPAARDLFASLNESSHWHPVCMRGAAVYRPEAGNIAKPAG